MKGNSSSEFNEGLFLRLANPPWVEGPRLDYKEEIFSCRDEESKFKYVKILIALANVSRRTRKESYILFGIKDNTREIVDVRNQYVGNKKSDIWDNPEIDIHIKQTECVRDQLINIADSWIDPEIPKVDYQYGEIDNKFVSYLIVKPEMTTFPYSLKKGYKNFIKGTVFVRKGSSSKPVKPSEVNNLLPCSSAAYLSIHDWRNLLDFHKSRDFHQAQNLYPFMELKVDSHPQISAIQCLTELLLQAKPRNVMLIGGLGTGKSVLLRKLTFILTSMNESFVDETPRRYFGEGGDVINEKDSIISISRELEVLPPNIVPLFFNLRTTFSNQDELEETLLKSIEEMLEKEVPFSISALFNIPNSKWALILDGLDELRNIESSGPILRTWIEKLPKNVIVCLSSRPDYEYTQGFEVINLSPLEKDNVKEFIELSLMSIFSDNNNLFNEDPILKVMEWLDKEFQIFMVLKNMRAVNAFISLISPQPPKMIDIDANIVDIAEANKTHISQKPKLNAESKNLPVISENEILGDGSDLHKINYEQQIEEVSLEALSLPTTAIAIQKVIDFIQEEEIKRRHDFGLNSKNTAKKARYCAENIAWKLRWSRNQFKYSDITTSCQNEQVLKWLQDVGFITAITENYYLFRFDSFPLLYFLAAEFAYFYGGQDDNLKQELKKKYPPYSIYKFINMLNELRIENGQPEIAFCIPRRKK